MGTPQDSGRSPKRASGVVIAGAIAVAVVVAIVFFSHRKADNVTAKVETPAETAAPATTAPSAESAQAPAETPPAPTPEQVPSQAATEQAPSEQLAAAPAPSESPSSAAGGSTAETAAAAAAGAAAGAAATAEEAAPSPEETPTGAAGQPSSEAAPGAAGAEAPSQRHQFGEEPDWPCPQRYVGDLSWGAIWTGPPLDDALKNWQSDAPARDAAVAVAAEGVTQEDGVKMIDDFAGKLSGADKDKELTNLFAGIFDSMNSQRSSMLKGIKRFVGRQQKVVAKLNDLQEQQREMEGKGIAKEDPKMADVTKQIYWNTRVYDERTKLTPYICDEPTLLEERLGAFARAIEGHLSTAGSAPNPG